MKFIIPPLAVLITVTIVLFGSPFRAIAFAIFWQDRLAVHNWQVLVVVCVFIAVTLALSVGRKLGAVVTIPFFCVVFPLLSVLFVGLYAGHSRREIMADFSADLQFQNSFWRSLHSAPVEWQFFLHAGAIKDCVPYAWSYRMMDMYELSPGVMFNVLPGEWLTDCDLEPPGR